MVSGYRNFALKCRFGKKIKAFIFPQKLRSTIEFLNQYTANMAPTHDNFLNFVDETLIRSRLGLRYLFQNLLWKSHQVRMNSKFFF